jgi:hypothetical protein
LRGEIHRDPVTILCSDVLKQGLNLFRPQNDWKDAVLEAIIVKNICKAGRNYTAKSLVKQGPWSVLARGAASEVVPGQQNSRTIISRLVEKKVRIECAILFLPPVIKQAFSQSRASDRLQKLLWDDLVSVHIQAIQRRDDAS